MTKESSMPEMIDFMLNKQVWAVVGATNNHSKFGYKILIALKEKGYQVYAVNPGYDEVDGDICYKSVSSLPIIPDCVNVVVNPQISWQVIDDVIDKRVTNIWFQPGSFNDQTIEKAVKSGLNTIYNNCVLVELKNR